MTRRARLTLFAVAAAGLAALLVWGTVDLPDFGHYHGRYGRIVSHAAVAERQMTNAVTATVFDIRGLDTMGEEMILFAAVTGVALLLRERRDEDVPDLLDLVGSDAVRAGGIALAAATLVLGLWVVAHGAVTPGGGFQGGVVLAAAFILLWLAGSLRSYRRLTPTPVLDFSHGTGAGAYVVIGLVALFLGTPFLHNLLPYGLAGKLSSGGSVPLLNWAVALEVTAAFALLFSEFLEERSFVLAGKRK
jgi:multicomponent Na+:H+ antiporter subunit B